MESMPLILNGTTYLSHSMLSSCDLGPDYRAVANMLFLQRLLFLNGPPVTEVDPRFKKYWHPCNVPGQYYLRQFVDGYYYSDAIDAIHKPLFTASFGYNGREVWISEALDDKYTILGTLSTEVCLSDTLADEVLKNWDWQDWQNDISQELHKCLERHDDESWVTLWEERTNEQQFALYKRACLASNIEYQAVDHRGLTAPVEKLLSALIHILETDPN